MDKGFNLTKENLQLVEYFSEQIPGGFFMYQENETRDLIYVNHVVLEIFGCETLEEFKDLTGYTFPGMVHPDDFEKIQASIDAQISKDDANSLDYVEYRIKRKDGTIRYVDDYGHFSKSEDFGNIYYVFISDITDKFLTIQEKERRANEAKNAFLFNISHDIRTPMNTILGFTKLALSHLEEPELLKDYLSRVNDSGKDLLSMIDNLLEMSQIDFGHMELNVSDCNLKYEIETLKKRFTKESIKKHQNFTFKVDVPNIFVRFDAKRFHIIHANLIENAMKFTPEFGNITVYASCHNAIAASSYATYEVTISDNGLGMSKEYVQKIFTPFEKEKSSTDSQTSGAGIGLSVVKQLVDLMGGTIVVDSKIDFGTTIKISLPIRVVKKNAENSRVLIVEDIENNQILLQTVLEDAGFLTEIAMNGQEALDAIKTKPDNYYDLILMDIQMPVLNGYDATKMIRSLDRVDVKTLPILALSANGRDEDRIRSLESGMDEHIVKPFEPEDLISTIEFYISENKK
ncbi:MAG: response regulator [Lachnospiraceae bacterium]|nr:response regulator [Lachnospiraceae bacterium]